MMRVHVGPRRSALCTDDTVSLADIGKHAVRYQWHGEDVTGQAPDLLVNSSYCILFILSPIFFSLHTVESLNHNICFRRNQIVITCTGIITLDIQTAMNVIHSLTNGSVRTDKNRKQRAVLYYSTT